MMNEKPVWVRRQADDYRIGKVSLKNIRDLQWRNQSGGVQAMQMDDYLFCKVFCNQIEAGDFGHSCAHLSPYFEYEKDGSKKYIHDILVCILKKDNPDLYLSLAEQAGSKPESKRRKPLTKAEKASRLYLIWGIPNKKPMDSYFIQDVLPEEYYTNSLILNFIRRCGKRKLNWAILSPSHGVWQLGNKKSGIEKYLRDATPDEMEELVHQIDQCAANYKKLLIYSGRPYDQTDLHNNVIQQTQEHDKVCWIDCFDDIR